MIDFIVIMILLAIILPIVCYMVKRKKKGNGCIGCPDAPSCGRSCHCDHKELPGNKS